MNISGDLAEKNSYLLSGAECPDLLSFKDIASDDTACEAQGAYHFTKYFAIGTIPCLFPFETSHGSSKRFGRL